MKAFAGIMKGLNSRIDFGHDDNTINIAVVIIIIIFKPISTKPQAEKLLLLLLFKKILHFKLILFFIPQVVKIPGVKN